VVTVVVVKYTQMVVNLTTQYITRRFGTIYRNLKLEGKKDGYTISITKADGFVLEKSRWSEK
jgi:hypothetical protein